MTILQSGFNLCLLTIIGYLPDAICIKTQSITEDGNGLENTRVEGEE